MISPVFNLNVDLATLHMYNNKSCYIILSHGREKRERTKLITNEMMRVCFVKALGNPGSKNIIVHH